MANIVIVDDREDLRETLKNLIEPLLPKKWGCVAIHPLDRLPQYIALLMDHDQEIAALVLDEKLHEAASAKKTNVSYSGTELAKFIRKHRPEFPIYLITSFAKELKPDNDGLFEELFAREEFQKQAGVHVKRIVRAGSRFTETFEKELGELSSKATLLAKGRATKQDIASIKAIREKLEIAFPLEELTSRAERLSELDAAIAKLRKLSDTIGATLKSPGRRKRK
jgi:CheY-like chemotaxis protein